MLTQNSKLAFWKYNHQKLATQEILKYIICQIFFDNSCNYESFFSVCLVLVRNIRNKTCDSNNIFK